jgi:acyl-CoA synthetase (AMP-forming)/AMP-acid ligase II
LPTALALIELDGVARRMVLCTPDLTPEQLAGVAATAQADAIVLEAPRAPGSAALDSLEPYVVTPQPVPGPVERAAGFATEWILLTSGTTGTPKLVLHTLQSLGGALPTQAQSGARSMEHLLRHSPLRRPADLFARRVVRLAAGALELGRADA